MNCLLQFATASTPEVKYARFSRCIVDQSGSGISQCNIAETFGTPFTTINKVFVHFTCKGREVVTPHPIWQLIHKEKRRNIPFKNEADKLLSRCLCICILLCTSFTEYVCIFTCAYMCSRVSVSIHVLVFVFQIIFSFVYMSGYVRLFSHVFKWRKKQVYWLLKSNNIPIQHSVTIASFRDCVLVACLHPATLIYFSVFIVCL